MQNPGELADAWGGWMHSAFELITHAHVDGVLQRWLLSELPLRQASILLCVSWRNKVGWVTWIERQYEGTVPGTQAPVVIWHAVFHTSIPGFVGCDKTIRFGDRSRHSPWCTWDRACVKLIFPQAPDCWAGGRPRWPRQRQIIGGLHEELAWQPEGRSWRLIFVWKHDSNDQPGGSSGERSSTVFPLVVCVIT